MLFLFQELPLAILLGRSAGDKFLVFLLLKMFLLSLSFWKKVLPNIEFWVDIFCLWTPEKCVTYSSGLHGFWWEIHFHSNWFSPVSKVLFHSYCFQDFILWFVYWSCMFVWFLFWCEYLRVYPFGVCSVLESWLVFCQTWKYFSHYFFKYTFSPTVFLLSLWNSDDINIRFFVSVPQVLEVLGVLFVSLFSFYFVFILQIG